MEDSFICLMCSGFYFILAHRRLVVDLKKMVVIEKFFPKYYCTPQNWMKRFLKIKINTIPKHIFYQCYFIFIYLIVGILGMIFTSIIDGKEIVEYYICTQTVIAVVESIINIILGKKLSLNGY